MDLSLLPEEIDDINSSLCKALKIIKSIEKTYNSKMIVMLVHDAMTTGTAYKINKLLRKVCVNCDDLTVLLESSGGDLNSSYKILKMFKVYSKRVRIIVPFFAKSAASIIALGADELVMCSSAELGSIDPQVRDPDSNIFVPAHSVKEAINFIQETEDPHVKVSLTDKISPLLVGAYRESAKSSKQYLGEIFEHLEKKEEAIFTFTERFLSHGYPIDRKLLKEIGIKIIEPTPEQEKLVYDLYETYMDLALRLYANNKEKQGELILLQSAEDQVMIFSNDDISNVIGDVQQKSKNLEKFDAKADRSISIPIEKTTNS